MSRHVGAGPLLFVTTGLYTGGAEMQLLALADGFVRRGYTVHVASMTGRGDLAPRFEAAQVTLHDLGMRRGSADPRGIVRLARLIGVLRPAVVHSHMVHANLLSRVTRLVARMPALVCTAHTIDEGSRARELGYRLTDRLASVTTSICTRGVERYVAVKAAPAGRIRYVPNGIDLVRFHGGPDQREAARAELGVGSDFVWLCTGRLVTVKEHKRLVEAARALPTGTRILIAGDGPLRNDLEAQIARQAVGDRVTLLGARDDIPRLLAAADGFVLPSSLEGLSIALLEAAACGVPAVACNVGGNTEIVVDGTTGFVVPAEDTSALAGAMQRLMALPHADRARFGAAAHAHVQSQFALGHVLDLWEQLYADARGGRLS